MSSKIVDLTNKKSQLIVSAESILRDKGHNSAEYRAITASLDVLQQDLDALNRIDAWQRTNNPNPVTPSVTPTISSTAKEDPSVRKQKLSVAYRSLLKNGFLKDAPEQRDIITTSGGAALIPQEFSETLTQALKWFGPIATLVSRRDVDTGAPQKWSVSDNTSSTMTYLSDSSSTNSVEEDPTLLSQVASTDALVSVLKYSLQQMNDAFGFESFIRDIAGLRAARAIEKALTVGTDGGGNALPSSPAGGLLASVPTGITGSSIATTLSYQNLANLAASVDHSYWVNGSYMASPSVFKFLSTVLDGANRPLYPIDPVSGLMQIAGRNLYVNNAMPAYNAVSSPVALFGDYSRAYAYVNAGLSIRILRERFVPDAMLGAAVIYTRIGACTLVSGAVKSLGTPAS